MCTSAKYLLKFAGIFCTASAATVDSMCCEILEYVETSMLWFYEGFIQVFKVYKI